MCIAPKTTQPRARACLSIARVPKYGLSTWSQISMDRQLAIFAIVSLTDWDQFVLRFIVSFRKRIGRWWVCRCRARSDLWRVWVRMSRSSGACPHSQSCPPSSGPFSRSSRTSPTYYRGLCCTFSSLLAYTRSLTALWLSSSCRNPPRSAISLTCAPAWHSAPLEWAALAASFHRNLFCCSWPLRPVVGTLRSLLPTCVR